jgi:hypothetical protein
MQVCVIDVGRSYPERGRKKSQVLWGFSKTGGKISFFNSLNA